jgi:hypothetical protein
MQAAAASSAEADRVSARLAAARAALSCAASTTSLRRSSAWIDSSWIRRRNPSETRLRSVIRAASPNIVGAARLASASSRAVAAGSVDAWPEAAASWARAR